MVLGRSTLVVSDTFVNIYGCLEVAATVAQTNKPVHAGLAFGRLHGPLHEALDPHRVGS